jgi:hypothetical protein
VLKEAAASRIPLSASCGSHEGMKYPRAGGLRDSNYLLQADQWTSFYESRPYPLVLDPLDILEMVCHLPYKNHLPYKKHSCNWNLTQCLSLVHSLHTCIGSTNMARLLHVCIALHHGRASASMTYWNTNAWTAGDVLYIYVRVCDVTS